MLNIMNYLKSCKMSYEIGVFLKIIYYDFVYDFFLLFKVCLRKKGLIERRKFDKIKMLKNKYRGKRCFIVATGPSLTYDDLFRLKGEVVLGVNSLVKVLKDLPYVPDFLGIQDAGVYEKIGKEIEESSVSHVFMTDSLFEKKCSQKKDPKYILYPKYNCRHSSHGDRRPLSSGFSDDPSVVVYDGYSITYSLLQIAVYMGFAEIYLLGCDCSYDVKSGKHHFVESGFFDKTASSVGERMIYAYVVAKKWLEKNRPDVHVINATRGGMLEVFPRKTLDEIF